VNGTNPAAGGSLTGIRVLEIGTSVAGPMAGQILADMGAEVVKVERAGTGDDSRSWAPPHWGGAAVTFLALNRGKRSLVLDFKAPQGQAVLERLVRKSDVLVQNLRPGALAAAGFSAERLLELNPQLVYCDLTGFGPRGPEAGKPAYDPLVQAYSGIVSMTGDDGGPPARVPVSVLDIGTGMWAVIAIYEALRRRDQTGKGSHLQLSLLQTALAWLAPAIMSVLAGNPPPRRLGSGFPGVVPYGAFPSADGWVFISAGNDAAWLRLCGALDAPELAAAPDFASNTLRASHRSEVTQSLAAVTARLPTAGIVARLQAAGVPCSPVNTIQDIVTDEQALATGMLSRLPRSDIPGLTVMNTPMTFNGAYPVASIPPPALGQGGEEALAAIGISPAEIEALVRAGIVEIATETPGLPDRVAGR
jgi:crotonobetainyl-CoA:carnitine CoA-transferase CaiB-like acyl-CoA transferase